IGGDFPEYIRIVDEGAEEIDRLDQMLSARSRDDRSIVRDVKPDHDTVGLTRSKSGHRAREGCRSDLCGAAAAPPLLATSALLAARGRGRRHVGADRLD